MGAHAGVAIRRQILRDGPGPSTFSQYHLDFTRLRTAAARFDYAALARITAGAVELLDRVLDVAQWPLPQQAAEAAAKRRLGLGMFGVGDAMAMTGLRYGSPESAAFAAEVSRTMRDAAYLASVELALKLGAFPLFDAENYLMPGTFASTLPQDIQDRIRCSTAQHMRAFFAAMATTAFQ